MAFAPQLLGNPSITVEAVRQRDAMNRIAHVRIVALGYASRQTTIISRSRHLRDLAQMLNLMRRFLNRARFFVFALRLFHGAQSFDERVELFSPRAGARP